MKDAEGRTALHEAARGGHCDCVDALVLHGADVNEMDNKRQVGGGGVCDRCVQDVQYRRFRRLCTCAQRKGKTTLLTSSLMKERR